MRASLELLLIGVIAAAAAGSAGAQTAQLPAPAASAASAPMPAASRPALVRNPAVVAAQKANESAKMVSEPRVVPQIAVPLKSRNSPLDATPPSTPPGVVPGTVNEGAARCLASSSAAEKAACERALAASAPVKPKR